MVRMTFCEVDDGFGFGAFWEHETGLDATADMVLMGMATKTRFERIGCGAFVLEVEGW